ncbi:hypothetical protein EV191_101935 [Tamaricihabitans halophyticus]|uniref:Uncharacterized protein n=1 Tax=Tamaricihabitans halophyticus TaxID=1262583 RepID=A0A4R2RC34_9PSEU|nr:hypothetical protein [Tamaricihabitans halophyticus]TCP56985.1 hypothetical protein EV191_101935 [Tamaricihabitans halophyticus]
MSPRLTVVTYVISTIVAWVLLPVGCAVLFFGLTDSYAWVGVALLAAAVAAGSVQVYANVRIDEFMAARNDSDADS